MGHPRLRRQRGAFALLVSGLLLLPRVAPASPGVMSVFAGGIGDGAPPTLARLFRPAGLATDPAGNLYIADTGNNRIRKVDLRGIITTIAGTGVAGYAGDNNDATKAKLNAPTALAVDPSTGVVLVADTGNNRVRRIAGGTITTFAGTGPASFSGDKNLAINARLNHPTGITFDQAGNVFIADTGNNRIRVVNQAGTITTFAGDGVRGFSGDRDLATVAHFNAPTSIATFVAPSSSGSLPTGAGATKDPPGVIVLVADTGNNRIRRIDTTGKVTTLAGTGTRGFAGDGGPATTAKLSGPTALQLDGNNNVFFVDSGNNRVRVVDGAGAVRTVAGSGVRGFTGDGGLAISARFAAPASLSLRGTGLYVADTGNNRVRMFSDGGYIATVAGSASDPLTGDGGSALAARLSSPTVTVAGPNGITYIADTGNHRIRRVGADGAISTVAGTGVAGFSGDGKAARLARLSSPQGLAVDRNGNLYISDTMNHRIRRVDTRGIITTVAGSSPGFAGDGKLARYAKFLVPTGLATDPAGNVFIADTANNRIRKINTRGIVTTIAGTGAKGYAGEGKNALGAALNLPFGVAADDQGNIYVADTFNNRVRVIGTTGIITTLAGTKTRGFIGDGGPAAQAQLNSPFAVSFDHGTTYIADTGNRRIRVVTPDGVIATIAGNGQTVPTPDGVPAVAATIVTPLDVTILAGGILVADAGQNRVWFIERTPLA